MSPVKKIVFAPLFLIALTASIYFYKQILDKYLDIFFLEYGGLYEFGLMVIPLVLAGLFFSLHITFTQDIKYATVPAFIASIIPFVFLPFNLSLVIGGCLFAALLITFFSLQNNLKTYTNFQPRSLLTGPIKTLSTLILLTLTFGYFLHTNSIIQREGFKIPDALIDWSINMSLSGQGMNFKGEKYSLAQLPTITQEQIDLLKANPEVLKQYGLSEKDLDSIVPPSKPAQFPNKDAATVIPSVPGIDLKDILKTQISNSLDQMIKPYLFAIPILLAVMFYSLASLVLWIATIFLSPLISLIFYVLDTTGFTKYEKEMREVKKIII